MRLTKAAIGKLKLPDGKSDAIFFDEDLKGFGLRIRAGGKRTWIAQYRVGNKQRRLRLGTVGTLDADEARKAARERLAAVELGHDPQADKAKARARAAITLGMLVDRFLAFKKPVLRANSYRAARLYLKGHWRPLHGLPIHEISRRDVAARLVELVGANGPVAASRARAALSSLFSWAVREGLCETNVVAATNEPAQPKSRDRVLDDGELAEIWAALREDDYGRAVKIVMLTGARRDEVGAMKWSELKLDQGLWVVPAERTKNHRPHVIPLPPIALGIIEVVQRRDGCDCVFGETTNRNGFNGWSGAKRKLDSRILKARQVTAKQADKPVDMVAPMAEWRLHDLRRTCATVMADRLGIQPHIIEAVLNHASGHKSGVAGIYNKAGYSTEKRQALWLWADHIRSVVERGERKVVPMRSA
jgi:integrase